MKYRKKPVIIEAYQTDKELDIETLEGTMHASVGDYIITGVDGEHYPCKPNIFEKTYELVDNGKATEVLTANAELIKNARLIAASINVHSSFQDWEAAEKDTLEKCADALEAANDQIEILQNQIKAYKMEDLLKIINDQGELIDDFQSWSNLLWNFIWSNQEIKYKFCQFYNIKENNNGNAV